MRLLVSVRSAVEVLPAVAGGADIIDAKEPSRGSLGPVSPSGLRTIARAVPGEMPFSVAVGDPPEPGAATAAVAGALDACGPRRGDTYVKLGLAGAAGGSAARRLIEGAVGAAGRASVVAVAYADYEAASAPGPADVVRLAADAGARGVLLDTWRKDGRDLFHYVGAGALREWIETARLQGLLVALAGSLDLAGVHAAARLPADVVGVRGAACVGGRKGMVVQKRVRALRESLDEAVSGPGRQFVVSH